MPKGALDNPEMQKLGRELLKDLKDNSVLMTRRQRTTGTTQVQSFRVKFSKPILDKIDDELIQMYGLLGIHADYIRS